MDEAGDSTRGEQAGVDAMVDSAAAFARPDERELYDEDEDVCRVCRTEAEPGNPLMYPCKCSGTIRYVHPECLKSWLAQSRKTHCELCGHKYAFTTVYAKEMPEQLPLHVLFYGSVLRTVKILKIIIRIILVAFLWLLVVPLTTLNSLWYQLRAGDGLASALTADYAINANLQDNVTLANNVSLVLNDTSVNATLSNTTAPAQKLTWSIPFDAARGLYTLATSSPSRLATLPTKLVSPLLRAQLLCISLIGLFLGFFLLREWVLHHQEEAALARATALVDEEPKLEHWDFENGQPKLKDMREESQRVLQEALETLRRGDTLDDGWREQMRANLELHKLAVEREIAEEDEEEQIGEVVEEVVEEDEPRDAPQVDGDNSADDEPASQATILRNDEPRSSGAPQPLFSRPGRFNFSQPAATGEAPSSADSLSEGQGSSSTPQGPAIPHDGPSPFHDIASSPRSESSTTPPEVRLRSPPRERPPLLWNATVPEPSPKHESAQIEFTSVPGVLPPTPPVEEQSGAEPEQGVEEAAERNSPHPPVHEVEPSGDESTNMEPVADDSSKRVGYDTQEDTGEGEDEDDWEDEDDGQQDEGEAEAQAEAQPDMLDDIEIVEMEDGEELPEEEFGLWDPEEWDGVMDMVGLRGTLLHLFGNITIAIMVLQTAVFAFCSAPAIIGKLSLVINGAAIQRVFLAPIRVVRFLTDPIVDVIVDILENVVYRPSKLSLQGFVKVMSSRYPATMSFLTNPIPQRLQLLLSSKAGSLAANLKTQQATTGLAAVLRARQAKSSKFARLGARLYDLGEGMFAVLGKTSRERWERDRATAGKLAAGTDTRSRAIIIALGYVQIALWVTLVGLFGEDIFGSYASSIVAIIRQQAIIFKLLVFMLIELVGFPFGAGIALQACLLPLFPEATIAGRLRDFASSPFLSTFVAWLFGTLFMFAFASLLAKFREVCRPGTMFFVRDPQDHNYSPVKDIVERTTLSQLRKLAFSAWMYGLVIVSLFGVIPFVLQKPPSLGLLPLNVKDRDPISTVPFDMIFIHIVLPASIVRLRPQRIFKGLLRIWWRRVTRALRLSSFMYNKRVPSEEEPRDNVFETRILPVVDVIVALLYGKAAKNESLTRVPAQDKVALLTAAKSKGSMFVQVDEQGVPFTDDGKMKILLQNHAARRNKRDPFKDYTIVWLPSYFQARINLFLLATLATGALGIAACAFVPLVTGRALLEWALDRNRSTIHDGYSYVAGFYFLWAAFTAGRWTQKKVAVMGRASRLRRSILSARIKRGLLSWMRRAYRVVAVYVVWPVLCGLVVEIYVLLPLKHGSRNDVTPVVPVWEAWALGCAINSILVHITDFARQPPTGHLRAMRIILKDPFASSVQEVTVVLRPLITGAVCLIAGPGVFVHLAVQVNPRWKALDARNVLLFRGAYTGVVLVFLAKLSLRPGRRFAAKWVQALRDRHYGVETRLENYEKHEHKDTEEAATQAATPNVKDVVEERPVAPARTDHGIEDDDVNDEDSESVDEETQ